MGNAMARDLADNGEGYGLSLDDSLSIHLRSNHYPPVHPVFIPIARKAIELANAGDWDAVIDMPNGISKSVSGIIEGLHLDAFLDDVEDYSDYE